jgi:hypothetical protein
MVESLELTGSPPTDRTRRWLPWAILVLLLLVSAALVLWAGRDTLFRGDDWDLFLYRGGSGVNVFLEPHNEHLSALMIAIYKALPVLVGPHYGAYRLTLVVLDLAVAALFFVFACERVGPWLGLVSTAPLLLMGAGSDNLLWPTQISVVGSLACGLAALILLDRRSLAAKAGACALLTGSVWFVSDGLFFLACAGIWLALSRQRWRDLWIIAVPAATYIAWYLGYGTSSFSAGNLHATPQFVLDLAAGGASALAGIRPSIGHAKAIGAIVGLFGLGLLAVVAVKVRSRLTPRLVAIVLLPPLSWLVIALGRAEGGDPFASRYVYPSAIFILMAILEIVRGEYVQRLVRGWRIAPLALVVAVSVGLNAQLLFEDGDYWRVVSQNVHGRTAAIELTRRTVDPNLALEPLQDMAHMTAGWYLNAVDKYGESPTGAPEIAGLNEGGRSAADQVLAAAAPAQYVPPPPGSGPTGAPPRLDPGPGKPATKGSCLITRPRSLLNVEVPASGLLIVPRRGTVRVALRRFASSFDAAPSRTVAEPALLVIPADHGNAPWHAQILSKAPASICGASADRRLQRGPLWPRRGDQHCVPMSYGEDECRFDRY